jgi:hypothetical protein
MDDQFKKGSFAVVPQKVSAEDHSQPLPPPIMRTYTEAVNQFTKNATAFIEQLPLLTKSARYCSPTSVSSFARVRQPDGGS